MFARCLLLLLAFTSSAWAIRSASPGEVVRKAASIVDATVTGFSADGEALLDVHAQWVGAPKARVKMGRHGCFLTQPNQFLKVGQRYILMLNAAGETHENIASSRVEGDLVHIDAIGLFPQTMSIQAFQKRLLAIRTAK